MSSNEELALKVQKLESSLHNLKETVSSCCSAEAQETRIRTVLLLENLDKKIDFLTKDLDSKISDLTADRDKTLQILNYHSKIIYVGIGILMVVEFLGVGDKIKTLLIGV